MQPDPLMRIGEIAAFLGISVKAVRVYDRKGLIRPAWVDPDTGYRYYSADQVQQFTALLELKTLGFTLTEIKRLLKGGAGAELWQDALNRRRMAWQDAIALAEDRIDRIDRVQGRIRDSASAARMAQMTEDQRAHLLAKLVCVEAISGRGELCDAIWL